jgi:hypothetical protein
MPHVHSADKTDYRTLVRICVTLSSLLRVRFGLSPDPTLSEHYPINQEICLKFLKAVSESEEVKEEEE